MQRVEEARERSADLQRLPSPPPAPFVKAPVQTQTSSCNSTSPPCIRAPEVATIGAPPTAAMNSVAPQPQLPAAPAAAPGRQGSTTALPSARAAEALLDTLVRLLNDCVTELGDRYDVRPDWCVYLYLYRSINHRNLREQTRPGQCFDVSLASSKA